MACWFRGNFLFLLNLIFFFLFVSGLIVYYCFFRMLREKWWNCRWAAAVLMLQKSQRPSSTGSASHWRVKCAFTKDCKSQIKCHTRLLDLYSMWKVHFLIMCDCFHRFMHKHPEDPSEVPNGFLSDVNSVSTTTHSTCLNSLMLRISNMFFFFL